VLFLYKLYYCFHRANVSAVYQPFRPCFGCTYLHCTALCFVSELKLKLNKNRAARIVLNVPPRTPSLPQSIYLYYNNYIGCQLKLEYHTNCVLLCIESPTELCHYLVELCQPLDENTPCSDTRLYVLRHAATIMSPVLTGVLLIVPFLSPPPLFGTVCLAISVAHLVSHLSQPDSRPTVSIPQFLPFST